MSQIPLSEQVALLEASLQRAIRVISEAEIALKAIGEPQPNDPPDAHICGVIARSCLFRMNEVISQKEGRPPYSPSANKRDGRPLF